MSEYKVVVGIPTFKRPNGLRRLLESIAKQNCSFELIVLVADNEGENGQGIAAALDISDSGFPFSLEAIAVDDRGISHVRNALMEKAFGDLEADMLAMVDDDEWVEPQWISSLVQVKQQTGADIVGGAVDPDFEVEPPKWADGLGIYYRSRSQESGLVGLVQGTTNVLISRTVYVNYPKEKFDAFYSLVGGGDKEFFMRLKRQGAIFAYSHLAKSHEVFGESRLTRSWALERAFRIGAGDMRIFLIGKPKSTSILTEVAKIFIAYVIYFFLSIISRMFDTRKYMRNKLKLFRQKGKVSGLLGKQKQVYKNVHGG